jgi:hypothetical protein
MRKPCPPIPGPVWYVQKVIPVQHCSTVFTSAVPSTDTNFLLLESLHKPGLYIYTLYAKLTVFSSGEEWVVKDGLCAVDLPTAFNSSRKGLQCNWLAVWIAIELSIGEVVSLFSSETSLHLWHFWVKHTRWWPHSFCLCLFWFGRNWDKVGFELPSKCLSLNFPAIATIYTWYFLHNYRGTTVLEMNQCV